MKKTTPRQKAIVDIIVMLISSGISHASDEVIINDFADPVRGNLLADNAVVDYLDGMLKSDTARVRFIGNVQRGLENALLSLGFYDTSKLPLDVVINLATHGYIDYYGSTELYYKDRLLARYPIAANDAIWAAARINIDEWTNNPSLLQKANDLAGLESAYIHAAKKPQGWTDVTANMYHDLNDDLLAKLVKCDSCSVGRPTGEIILYEGKQATAYIPQTFEGTAWGAAEKYIRTFELGDTFQFAGRIMVRRETRKRRPYTDTHLLAGFINYLVDYGQIKVDEEGDLLSDDTLHIIRTLYRAKLWDIDVKLEMQNIKQITANLKTWGMESGNPFPAVLKQAETGVSPDELVLTVRSPRLHSDELSEVELGKLRLQLAHWGIVDNSADLIIWDARLMDTLVGRGLVERGDIWASMVSTQKKQDVRLSLLPADDEGAMNKLRETFTFGFAYALALKHNYSTTRIVNINSRKGLDLLEHIVYNDSLERECLMMRQIYSAVVSQDNDILTMLFKDAIRQAAHIKNDYSPVGIWQNLILGMLQNEPEQKAGQTQSNHIDEIIDTAAWDLAKGCDFDFECIKAKSQNIIQRTIKGTLASDTARYHLKSWDKENATGKLQIGKGVKSRAMMIKAAKPRPTHFEDYMEAKNG